MIYLQPSLSAARAAEGHPLPSPRGAADHAPGGDPGDPLPAVLHHPPRVHQDPAPGAARDGAPHSPGPGRGGYVRGEG